MGRASLWIAITAAAVSVAACDNGNGVYFPDADPPDAEPDADQPDGDTSDAGCQLDNECDDGIDCTGDVCDRSTGLCTHAPEHERCHDESQCNGFEYCDPMLGCLPGIPYPGCNDHIACTVDTCIEPDTPGLEPVCEHRPMDRDGDGHVDNHCAVDPIDDPDGPRGDDCDDLDPMVFPGAGEFCFDELDNDCDLDVDMGDEDCCVEHVTGGECHVPNDGCDGAVELIPGRVREGFTIGADPDPAPDPPGEAYIDIGCGWTSYQDVAYFFTLTEAADVTIDVWGRDYFYPITAIQRVCGDPDSEVRCISGSTEVRFFGRGMEPGTYYVIVESWAEGIFDILLTVESVTPPPEGEDCTDPIALTEGVTATVDIGDYETDVPVTCAAADSYTDVVYAIALSETQDLRFDASGDGVTPYVAVRSVCEEMGTEVFCDGGNPQSRSLCALTAGTYYMIVRGNRAGDIDLTVTLSDPSSPPANDLCADALDVSSGGTFSGSLLCSAGDYDLSCDFWDEHDVVFTFTVDEPQDVELTLSAEDDLRASMAVQTICGDRDSELLCLREDRPYRLLRNLPAGTYYVLVAGEYAAEFELDVTFSAATSACDGATVVTESIVISDDTTGLPDDFRTTCGGRGEGADLPYLLDIPFDFDLVAEVTDALFDTVLHIRTACDDLGSQIECNDDGGSGTLSRLDIPGLAAGTYVMVFDGFWDGAEGPFTLDVDITPTVVDPCASAPVLAGTATETGDTCGAAGSEVGDCGDSAPDIVYAIELLEDSTVVAELTAASFEPVLYLRGICDDPASQVACDPGVVPALPRIDTALTAGTYYLFVDGALSAACGTFTLELTVTTT